MNPNIYQLLGLATRARKITTGEEQVVLGIQRKQISLVLLATDASANTSKKLTDKTNYYKIPILYIGTRSELGHAIGKEERVVLGITDQGFARRIRELYEENV